MNSHGASRSSRAVHFPGLNGLRFLAALTVVLYHASFSFEYAGIPQYDYIVRLNPQTGFLCVVFFFVLSGFLITYLLLAEEAETGEIYVRGFYLRRVLRIWPLYYLIVTLAFFVLPRLMPAEHPPPRLRDLVLYTVMLPNFAGVVPGAGHLWSIGVEEQFYLCWPLLLRIARRRHLLFLGVVVGYLSVLAAVRATAPAFGAEVLLGVDRSRVDAMAIGALGGWLLFGGVQPVVRVVFSRLTQASTFVLLGALYLRWLEPPRLTVELYEVLFMIVILNVAANPRSLVGLRGRLFERLGKISYGIYMYHPVGLLLANVLVMRLTAIPWVFALAYYALVVTTTVSMAAVSYDVLEKPILERKLRFSRLRTGDFADLRPTSELIRSPRSAINDEAMIAGSTDGA